MTQHPSSLTDQHPSTAHPHATIATTADHQAPWGPSGWWFGFLALLPIACCALPLLLVAGVSASSGAVLGGVTGGLLMLAGTAVFGLREMRRRAQHRRTHSLAATSPRPDRCC